MKEAHLYQSFWGKIYVLLLSCMYWMESCLLCFLYFFFNMFYFGLLDCKGLLNCSHMLSFCAAVTDLNVSVLFSRLRVWWMGERKRDRYTVTKEKEIKKVCKCECLVTQFWDFFQIGATLNHKSLIQYILLLDCITFIKWTVYNTTSRLPRLFKSKGREVMQCL